MPYPETIHILKMNNHPISLDNQRNLFIEQISSGYFQFACNHGAFSETDDDRRNALVIVNDELVSPKLGIGSKMGAHKIVYMGAVLPQSSSKNELSHSTSPK